MCRLNFHQPSSTLLKCNIFWAIWFFFSHWNNWELISCIITIIIDLIYVFISSTQIHILYIIYITYFCMVNLFGLEIVWDNSKNKNYSHYIINCNKLLWNTFVFWYFRPMFIWMIKSIGFFSGCKNKGLLGIQNSLIPWLIIRKNVHLSFVRFIYKENANNSL